MSTASVGKSASSAVLPAAAASSLAMTGASAAHVQRNNAVKAFVKCAGLLCSPTLHPNLGLDTTGVEN